MLHPLIRTPNVFDVFKAPFFQLGARGFAGLSDPSFSRLWRDEGDAYRARFDAPGVKPEDVHVAVEGRVVSVAFHREGAAPEGYEVAKKERRALKFSRRFSLGPELDPASLSAKLEHGVLSLKVNKVPKSEPREIVVNAPTAEES